MAQISFSDLLSQEIKHHPYTFFGSLRAQGPLTYMTSFMNEQGAWIVTNYDDAIEILKDPRFTKDRHKIYPPTNGSANATPDTGSNFFFWRRDMLATDPPDHTRLRGLVSKAFTPRMIERLRPRIQQIAHTLIDAVEAKGSMDLVMEFAVPLPITVISEMLGIPVEDRQQFRVWTQILLNGVTLPGQEQATQAAGEAFIHYIKTLVATRHKYPGEDLVSEMIKVEDQGDVLSEYELVSTIWLLILAGHETTINLIGSGMLALLEHPEQLRLLQQDTSLLPSAVEELLRYTTPISLSSFRWANEDILMHDQLIRKGSLMFIALIAANADPKYFTDPEALDVTRQVNKHLAFGKGIHSCLGAPLARIEGQIAFSTLLQRLPHLRLAEDPEDLRWNSHPILRGLTSLPVTF